MMIAGNATIYVANMDQAIGFYTDVLGLTLRNRFGDKWATVRAGNSLVVGLHPCCAEHPRPGTKGSVQLGLVLSPGDSIEAFAARVRQHGVSVSDVMQAEAKYVSLADPDGNQIYVTDRDPAVEPQGGAV